jgi:hypothetical protein
MRSERKQKFESLFETKKAEFEAKRTRDGLENPASKKELKAFKKKIFAEFKESKKALRMKEKLKCQQF